MAQPFRVEAILDELSEDEIPPARIKGNLQKIDRYFASDRIGRNPRRARRRRR
jgi:hypothetical protein